MIQRRDLLKLIGITGGTLALPGGGLARASAPPPAAPPARVPMPIHAGEAHGAVFSWGPGDGRRSRPLESRALDLTLWDDGSATIAVYDAAADEADALAVLSLPPGLGADAYAALTGYRAA